MTNNAEVLATIDRVSVDYQAIGQLFKQAREAKKLTIIEASAEIHIRQLYLKSIEAGDLEALPGHIYKVGFIKTYATFLGLNTNQILQDLQFVEEIAPDYSSFSYAVPIEKQKRPGIKTTLAAATLLFVGGVVLYVSDDLTVHESENVQLSSLSAENPPAITEMDTPVTPNFVSANPVPDLETAPIQTDPELAVTPTDMVSVDSAAVKVIATKDAWVQVSDESGKAIFVRLMRAGESYTVPAQGNFKLNTGNGGGVKLSVGDQTSKPLGDEGKVIRGIDLSKLSVETLVR